MSCIYLSYTITYVICPVSVCISSIFVKMFVEFQKTPIDTVYKYLFQFSANILLGNLKWKNSFFCNNVIVDVTSLTRMLFPSWPPQT